MAVAEAVVSFAIERLGNLLLNEAKFLYGVKGQVDEAKDKLLWMRAFLRDADSYVRNGDNRVRLWVDQVRDISYNLEDVIEAYIFRVALKSNGGVISFLRGSIFFSKKGIIIHRLGSEIEKISSTIANLTSNLDTYGVKELRVQEGGEETSSHNIQLQRELRKSYSHVLENDVVGLENDIEVLVAHLTAKNASHKRVVISICGMGGLGKTTLARKVYHHPQVRTHFDCFAWASISQQCDVRQVWEGILIGLTSPTTEKREEIKNMMDREVAKELYDLQCQKKCLVLLDDIWSSSTWDRLQVGFPRDETDSKILLTTRVENVVAQADQNCYIHKPMCLDKNQSWELFRNKCFGKDPTTGSQDSKRKKDIGRAMLKYCSGLPLAIVVLGGLLSTKHTVSQWELVESNVMTHISNGRPHNDSKYHDVSSVLGLSYDELPYYLKPCFLYLARYPEDAKIRVKELCLMLIAEGFISPRTRSKETMEEVAYDYLSELVERSIVQVESWGLTGTMKTFIIHDLMRDLCLSKAREEKFFMFIDSGKTTEEPLESIDTNARRVAVHFDFDPYPGYDFAHFLTNNTSGPLRCVILDGLVISDKLFIDLGFSHFLMLRVLSMNVKVCTKRLFKQLGKLIHLRFLSLRGFDLAKIASCIGNLRSMQTLKFEHWRELNTRIPNVMWKLEQLRHLYLPDFNELECGTWLKLPNPRHLQTLVNVKSSYLDKNDFAELKNLKTLKIHVDENMWRIYQDPPSVTFHRLQNLHLLCNEHKRMDIVPVILSYPRIYKLKLNLLVMELPEHHQFSPNLAKLELHGCFVRDDPMPILEKLSSLRFLSFYRDSYIENKMVCSRGGFPRLESLQIMFLENLEEWRVEEGALSCLSFLGINGCSRLRRFPHGLRHITTLKEMVIKHMPREFKERAEENGRDFDKVQHVPCRVFIRCE